MGRELKRVPLDFNPPLNKTYDPNPNPYYKYNKDCSHCRGKGVSPHAVHLENLWYGKTLFIPEERGSKKHSKNMPAIIFRAQKNIDFSPEFYGTSEDAVTLEAERLAELYNQSLSYHLTKEDIAILLRDGHLKELTHDWTRGTGWVEKTSRVELTPEYVNSKLIEDPFLSSSKLLTAISKYECEQRNEPFYCPNCEGKGNIWIEEKYKQLCEEWVNEDIPVGEGYQMWSTTIDGPISPVFKQPKQLARWLTANRKSGMDKDWTFNQWILFINDVKWCPTGLA